MNVSIVGLFSNHLHGIVGCYIYSITHALIASGLFLIIGFLYNRYHTRTMKYFRGLALFLPTLISLLFLFSISNISFPGTAGFIPELLLYASSIHLSPLVLFLLLSAVLLLPLYFIYAFHKISFGLLSPYLSTLFQDLSIKEFHTLFPLIFFIFYLGLFPNILLDSITLSSLSLLH